MSKTNSNAIDLSEFYIIGIEFNDHIKKDDY